LVLVQRIVPKTPTGISPFELLYGRRPILCVERMLANKHSFDVIQLQQKENQNETMITPSKAALEELGFIADSIFYYGSHNRASCKMQHLSRKIFLKCEP
jgi:hypothetical protein